MAGAAAGHDLERDENALELRRRGRSFAGIARLLGYERTHHAHTAYNRALRRRPAAERATLRKAELTRLASMAGTIRRDQELSHQEIVRRLRAVGRLRALLLAD